jgi:hypothetical protein
MPSFDPVGQVDGDPVVLVSATGLTASGSSGPTAMGAHTTLRLWLRVSAASGTTPSMTVTVETSGDATTWSAVGTFTAATGVTAQRKVFSGLDRYARVSYAITGTTPSFTFTVAGEAV